ncbi:hypothetical protein AVDCRST_MAG94-5778 [uncultured Leptolyngbya sp.]|uniref:Uncharacterized protein n=1 Tax=uncultured Leptolyngbya sp. TaxID=332963 RepID=A0A6J4NVK0_9CYAN|nr:hypothetical protein AVDCRST_MAG94-5778 [uncultured Leptolyngbya sp.]
MDLIAISTYRSPTFHSYPFWKVSSTLPPKLWLTHLSFVGNGVADFGAKTSAK